MLPEIARQQQRGKEVVFRAGPGGRPAFAKPEIHEALKERGVKYAIRLPANDCLERDIAELLTRPLGRPIHTPVVRYQGFLYQAESWKKAPEHAEAMVDGLGSGFWLFVELIADIIEQGRFIHLQQGSRRVLQPPACEVQQVISIVLLCP